MKKFISLILAVVMVMAIGVTSFAGNNCPHFGSYVDTEPHYVASGNVCEEYEVKIYYCAACDKYNTISTFIRGTAHTDTYDHATCNGYVQTLYYACTKCNRLSTDTDTVTCPGSGQSHANGCRWISSPYSLR